MVSQIVLVNQHSCSLKLFFNFPFIIMFTNKAMFIIDDKLEELEPRDIWYLDGDGKHSILIGTIHINPIWDLSIYCDCIDICNYGKKDYYLAAKLETTSPYSDYSIKFNMKLHFWHPKSDATERINIRVNGKYDVDDCDFKIKAPWKNYNKYGVVCVKLDDIEIIGVESDDIWNCFYDIEDKTIQIWQSSSN